MDIAVWQTQLRKGAAELVVLAQLSRGDSYGVQILDAAGRGGGVLSDGTIYPLLTRLEREGKITSRWEKADALGNPRKYYRLTEDGAETLRQMQMIWRDFSSFVSSFMESADVETDVRRRGLSREAG